MAKLTLEGICQQTNAAAKRDQLLYLNSGSAVSASLVAPGRTTFLSSMCSEPNGTTTYFVPSPRKPPTDNTANGAFSVGVTISLSIDPTV